MIENCLHKTKAQSVIYVKLRTLSFIIDYSRGSVALETTPAAKAGFGTRFKNH